MDNKVEQGLTVADKIWQDIKDLRLELFALPNQFVNSYCEQIKIEPSKLYLTSKVSAVLPILEEALRGRYNVEKINKYIVVSIPSDL
jgi:hypothetical protein